MPAGCATEEGRGRLGGRGRDGRREEVWREEAGGAGWGKPWAAVSVIPRSQERPHRDTLDGWRVGGGAEGRGVRRRKCSERGTECMAGGGRVEVWSRPGRPRGGGERRSVSTGSLGVGTGAAVDGGRPKGGQRRHRCWGPGGGRGKGARGGRGGPAGGMRRKRREAGGGWEGWLRGGKRWGCEEGMGGDQTRIRRDGRVGRGRWGAEGTQDSYVAGSSGKDKEPTQKMLLHLANEKPSESSQKTMSDVKRFRRWFANKGKEQHQMTEDEQVLRDELEKMIAQEVVAKALDDATRQAFKEEKRNIASQKGQLRLPYAASTPTEDDSDAFSNAGIFTGAYDDKNVGVVADFNNMDDTINVSPIPTTQNSKGYPKLKIYRTIFKSDKVQTRGKIQKGFFSTTSIAMQEDCCMFLNYRRFRLLLIACWGEKQKAIGTSRSSRIEGLRCIVVEKPKPGFAFLYGTIEEEGCMFHQPPGFVDLAHPNKVYKVITTLYGLHQAPRAWYETLSSFLMENGFKRGLQVKEQPDGIFISQDKYVADILKKFDYWSIRTASTPIESNKPLVKDKDGEDVDVHVYRSMIGSLMYLTASRPDIMFAVCACARFQVTLKASHLNAIKRIFRCAGQFLGRRLISWQNARSRLLRQY
ncbi:putative ribonuclease H-like domain-containing protein [Tanacetum coccineum]